MMSPSSPPEPSGGLRASDAERERVAEALRRHHLDGRIDTDELQERLERCYAARTGGELAALLAVLLAFATVGAVAHGHPGPFPFLAVLLLLKLAWGGPWRRRTAWRAR